MTEKWETYVNDRLFIKRDGYYVIKPKFVSEQIPLACEICGFLFRTNDDETSYGEFGCCSKCALRWAHPDRDRWKTGWRPSQEQIVDDVSTRSKMTVTIT